MKHLHLVHQNGNDVFSWGAPGCEDLGMNHHLQVHLTGTHRSRVVYHWCWWWTFQWQLDWETQSSAIGTESSLEKSFPNSIYFVFFIIFLSSPNFQFFQPINQIHLFVLIFFFFFSIFKHKILILCVDLCNLKEKWCSPLIRD